MTDSLLSLTVRGTRRIRLFFSSAPAAGAYTSTSFYAVQNDDGHGAASISVVSAFAIASNPNALELAIDSDVVDGALYTITVTAVPMADATTVTGSLDVRTGSDLATLSNVEPAQNDLALILYGRDLQHDGNDFVATAAGDLGVNIGRPCWQADNTRRLSSAGLGWDPTYGPNADAYVNAPSVLQLPLKGVLLAQARLDDRTKSATCDIVQDPLDPGNIAFLVSLQGKDELDPITIAVPISP